MLARNLDELQVYRNAVRAGDAISALLKLPGFCKEFKLVSQLGEASDSVSSNIAEGFGRSERKCQEFCV
jgi:four helix bundle protein